MTHAACPCLHVEPCDPSCSCVNPVSSRGCTRCCSYGSKEQQVEKARWLVEMQTAQNSVDNWKETAQTISHALDAAEAALAFYADPATYFAIAFVPDPPNGEFMDDFSDTELGSKPGKLAREYFDVADDEESEPTNGQS